MGSTGEEAPAPTYFDSVMSPNSSISPAGQIAGAIDEPLVHDFAAMQDGRGTRVQEPPLTPPSSDQKPSLERQDSWLSDEDSAPAPPDLSRRGIHVPLRTR